MKDVFNPFMVTKYHSPELFCDRERETKDIMDAIKSGRHITLYSLRKMGKTGLINHVFHLLNNKRNKKPITIHIDIFDTVSNRDFVNEVVSKVVNAIEKNKTNFTQKIVSFFGRYRPTFSYDPFTGTPTVQLDIKNQEEVRISLDTLFEMVAAAGKTVIIAIDEFQQVEQYPEQTLPATLRKYLQTIDNLLFIFSGSQKSMLLEMFSSPKKALFSCTQMYPLGQIDQTEYQKFIRSLFLRREKNISDELVQHILEWTRGHTYYTQFFCNRLYEMNVKKHDQVHLDTIKNRLFKEHEGIYFNYLSLLTNPQIKLLRAIANEGIVTQPTSKDFIKNHNLGAHSTVRQSLKFLLDKEIIFKIFDENDKPEYHVYDVFLWRWVSRKNYGFL